MVRSAPGRRGEERPSTRHLSIRSGPVGNRSNRQGSKPAGWRGNGRSTFDNNMRGIYGSSPPTYLTRLRSGSSEDGLGPLSSKSMNSDEGKKREMEEDELFGRPVEPPYEI